MRLIVIDASLVGANMRGMGIYTSELLRQLAHYKKNRLLVVTNNISSFRYIRKKFQFSNGYVVFAPLPYPIFEQIFLPLILCRNLFSETYYVSSGDTISIGSLFCRSFYLLHDFFFWKQDLYYDRSLLRSIVRIYRRMCFVIGLKHASDICTVSNFTRRELISNFNTKYRIQKRLFVCENGTNFTNLKTPFKMREFDFIFISGIDPQKRLNWALKVLIDGLPNFSNYSVAVVGVSVSDATVERSNIFYMGYLRGKKVEALLNNSKIVIVPSVDESFGVPVIEGIVCGCKVMVSDKGALTETGGQFVSSFKSDDSESFLKVLSSLIEREPHLKPQKDDFSWNSKLSPLVSKIIE